MKENFIYHCETWVESRIFFLFWHNLNCEVEFSVFFFDRVTHKILFSCRHLRILHFIKNDLSLWLVWEADYVYVFAINYCFLKKNSQRQPLRIKAPLFVDVNHNVLAANAGFKLIDQDSKNLREKGLSGNLPENYFKSLNPIKITHLIIIHRFFQWLYFFVTLALAQ